ncbi:MAG: GntR family transcriptional regulator [Lachnospiraceae bacterium]|nr:GntR family transcriptional regulator [Lachnospiraceae bacterium]
MKKKYTMIKESLLGRIRSGEFQKDKAIPSERDLAAYYEVNRMTVRKALEDLMYEGLLIRRMGSGTFLTDTKKSRSIWDPSPDRKSNLNVKLISCKPGDECNYGYRALQIEEGRPYWRMRRIRMEQGIPYAYEDIYFHPEFFERLSSEDYELGLHQLIQKYMPDHGVMTYDEVEALNCLHNTSLYLKVEVGSPILQIKSYFVHDERIIMHCRSYHPGDQYKYLSNQKIL